MRTTSPPSPPPFRKQIENGKCNKVERPLARDAAYRHLTCVSKAANHSTLWEKSFEIIRAFSFACIMHVVQFPVISISYRNRKPTNSCWTWTARLLACSHHHSPSCMVSWKVECGRQAAAGSRTRPFDFPRDTNSITITTRETGRVGRTRPGARDASGPCVCVARSRAIGGGARRPTMDRARARVGVRVF